MIKKDCVVFFDIIIRYLLILLAGSFNLYLFYFFLTPLTLYGSYFLLSLFYDVILYTEGFLINDVFFELVKACVGGSAFFLLFILNLSSRDIGFYKRINILLFSFLCLYIFNVLRILLMVSIYNFYYFEFVHMFFWYFISTLFVFCLWIFSVWFFKIKTIPVYSDFRFIAGSLTKKRKRKKIRKKD